MNHSEIVSFIWGVADLIRDVFKRGKYQDVILPLTVLRRLDSVLAGTKAEVLRVNAQFTGKLEDRSGLLCAASDYRFYNTSEYTFDKLVDDAPHAAENLRNYIAGFSDNMREVIEKFDFDNTISKLDEAGLLFKVLERFRNVDLHLDNVDNATMGTIFEELIRKFNEALNENPGEHFTPRDVVHLMVDLMLAGDEQAIAGMNAIRTIYDPCCGSGGMLTIAKGHITEGITNEDDVVIQEPINVQADIHLFGQEVNPETFAICKSDLFMKSKTGLDAENIAYGSTLSADRHEQRSFDYMITNPPYGKDWKMDQEAVKSEAERGNAGRFGVGLPRISDGQLLFLQHLIAHMKKPSEGGSRIAIIMNGSPLFTGGAGSGESEIRRWVLENDWLETLVALPEQLFYNTGIATYVWVLTNRKSETRKGKVQLIDATSFWAKRKSLGAKRRDIPHEKAVEILRILDIFEEGEFSKIFPTTQFGYRRITVERPLRLNFQASPERIELLETERAFARLAESKKRNPEVKAQEQELGRKQQERILAMLADLPSTLFKERPAFEKALKQAAAKHQLKLDASLKKAILNALSERDETAEICRDKKGNPEPDTNLRDTENVPLSESVESFFEREVKPHVPDPWIDESKRDEKDNEVGVVGYEINFNRYFYTYEPPRPLEEIEKDIKTIESEIMEMLREVAE